MKSLLELFLIIFEALLAYLIKVAIRLRGWLGSPSTSSLLENQLPFSTSICSCRNKGEARVYYDAYNSSYQKLKEAESEITRLKRQITQFTESMQYFRENYYQCRDEALQWREFVNNYLGYPARYPWDGINRIENYNGPDPQLWEENRNVQVVELPQDDELQDGHREHEEEELEFDEWEAMD